MRIHYTLFPENSCHFTLRTINCHSLDEDKCQCTKLWLNRFDYFYIYQILATLLEIAEQIAAAQPTIVVQEQRLPKWGDLYLISVCWSDVSRKRSPPHEGIVFLMDPSEWLKEDWKLIAPRLANPHSVESDKELSPERSSSPRSPTPPFGNLLNVHKVQGKSYSAPSSPVLRRQRVGAISHKERSRFHSNSSFDDLINLGDDDLSEAEKVAPIASRKEQQPKEDPDSSQSKEKMLQDRVQVPQGRSNPSIAVVPAPSSADDGHSHSDYPQAVPITDSSQEPAKASNSPSDSDSEQHQASGNLLSRFTSKFLLKKHPNSPENYQSPEPQEQSSVKAVFQVLRTGLINLANTTSLSQTPPPSSDTSGNLSSSLTPSETEQILDQLKQNSRTKFIYI